MHFKTGLFYYFQDPPRQYKSGIVTMVWLTSTFHTVIHSVALNCGTEDNMGWRVATQVYDGHRSSSGRLGLGHLGHLAAGGTPSNQATTTLVDTTATWSIVSHLLLELVALRAMFHF